MAQPVGSRIGVISNSDIRYEGLLHNIDANNNTITLLNVRLYGTEGRRQGSEQVAPSDQVYEYIVFSGADIKDLTLYENQTPANDPAIVSAAPGRNVNSLPPAKTVSSSSPQPVNQPLAPTGTSSQGGTNIANAPSIPSSAPTSANNAPNMNMPTSANAAGAMMHNNVNTMMNRNMSNNRVGGNNMGNMRHGNNASNAMNANSGNMMSHRGMYDNNNMYYHNQPRRGGYGMMGGRYNANNGGYHNNYNNYNNYNSMHQGGHRYHRGGYGGRGMYSNGHYRRRPEGHTGQDFQPATGGQKEEFKEEFDFTKSRE